MRKGDRMRKIVLAVVMLVGATAGLAAEPASDPAALVGLPLYSADGERIGEITSALGDKDAVEVEVDRYLGFGTSTVVVHAAVLERRADRLVFPLDAHEVRDLLAPKPADGFASQVLDRLRRSTRPD